MKGRKIKGFTEILPRFMLVFPFLFFSIVVLAFLIFGKEANFQSESLQRIAACACSGFFIICGYIGVSGIMDRMKLTPRRRILLLSGIIAAAAVLMSVLIPYSPGDDSYDMSTFLELISENRTSEFMSAYLSAYATNKLAMYFYLLPVKWFGSVEAGVRLTHFILMGATMFFVAGSCKRLFSSRTAELSTLICAVYFPFFILLGPYIYPISIFLSAAAFFLYSGKMRILSLLIGGLLFTIRPLAAGFLLVYILLYDFFTMEKKRGFCKAAGWTALALTVFLGVSAAVGHVLYLTKLHTYPKLNSVALLWTLEVGTREQGDRTGTCTYSPEDTPFDPVSEGFKNIWNLYRSGGDGAYIQVKAEKQRIGQHLSKRIMEEILKSPESFGTYIEVKFKNYFSDNYKMYYYSLNIHDPNLTRILYYNVGKRYFLAANVFILTFFLCGIGILVWGIYRLSHRGTVSEELSKLIAMIIGTGAVCILAILLTEVGKRLILDVTVPMLIIISFAFGKLCESTQCSETGNYSFPKRNDFIMIGLAVVFALLIHLIYAQFNMDIFKNSRIELKEKNAIFHFEQTINERGFYFRESDGSRTEIFGKNRMAFEMTENRYDFLTLITPWNEHHIITKMRIID